MTDPIISRKAAKSLRLFRNNDSSSHHIEEETQKHHHGNNNNIDEETCSSAIFLPHEDGLLPEELKPGSLDTSAYDCNDNKCETRNILEDLDGTPSEVRPQANVTPRDENKEQVVEEHFDCEKDSQQQQQQPQPQQQQPQPQQQQPQQQQRRVEEYPLAVELQPFHNKVGGHTAIFKFSHRAVCKELVNRENQWYEIIEVKHPELLNFMPKYIGVLNVRYNDLTRKPKIEANTKLIQDDLPEVSLVDNPHMIPSAFNSNPHSSNSINFTSNSNNSQHNKDQIITANNTDNSNNNSQFNNNCNSGSNNDHEDNNTKNKNDKNDDDNHNNTDSIGSTKVNIKLKELVFSEMFSPKAIKRHRRSSLGQEPLKSNYSRRHRYSTNSAPSNRLDILNSLEENPENAIIDEEACIDEEEEGCRIERFLLLEDLTHGMKHPSVLDLKMGTRQYGIEASIKKRISQRKKCSDTTSRSLGTRICGMQVWDKPTKKFINRDKYFGRSLKVGESFVKSICRFLYDGESIYSILRHIKPLLKSCDELLKRISNLINYRLYGSSILLMYDDRSEIIVRLIDFAQCVIGDIDPSKRFNVTFPPVNLGHCDAGYLRGLKSLKFYFTLIFEQLTNGATIDEIDINDDRFKINCPWLDAYESNDDYVCPYDFNKVPNYDNSEVVSE